MIECLCVYVYAFRFVGALGVTCLGVYACMRGCVNGSMCLCVSVFMSLGVKLPRCQCFYVLMLC